MQRYIKYIKIINNIINNIYKKLRIILLNITLNLYNLLFCSYYYIVRYLCIS